MYIDRFIAVLLICWCAISTTQAGVSVSVEYIISPMGLKNIASSLQQAQTRSEEMMIYPIYSPIFDNGVPTQLTLFCPPKFPDVNGEGCALHFRPKSTAALGQISITIFKPVLLQLLMTKVTDIESKLKSLDPNRVDDYDHQHFGNPLYSVPASEKDGTHYFCQPVGASGDKTWECHLFVSDRL